MSEAVQQFMQMIREAAPLFLCPWCGEVMTLTFDQGTTYYLCPNKHQVDVEER